MIILLCFVSFFLGGILFFCIHKIKTGGVEKLAQEILTKAQRDAEQKQIALDLELKKREFDVQLKLGQRATKEKEKISRREEKIDKQLERVENKLFEISKREKILEKIEEQRQNLAIKHQEVLHELEKISSLTQKEAQALLFEKISKQIQSETASLILRKKKEAEQNSEIESTRIIATAINRLTLSTISELCSVTVSLPNSEMKGRLIGREGRNIRALEKTTGVTFVIDDTPNAVVISGFDPIRKEIAKQVLKALIQDGRIHPTRIEEVVEIIQQRMKNQIKKHGEAGALRASVGGLHPELIKLLGKLNFCYSYGQNVLEHSLEVSHLMGMICTELNLDRELGRRIGLLHDIGKAVSHEVEGSHALIGRDMALRFEENEAVANGIGCHHEEIMPLTIEGSLCEAADKISGGRLGARVEALEHYLKRTQKLEYISTQFPGVKHAYALQAGREIRVIIEPEKFDDTAIIHLARNIAKKIEQQLTYPGKIKVIVIREKRAITYAT